MPHKQLATKAPRKSAPATGGIKKPRTTHGYRPVIDLPSLSVRSVTIIMRSPMSCSSSSLLFLVAVFTFGSLSYYIILLLYKMYMQQTE